MVQRRAGASQTAVIVLVACGSVRRDPAIRLEDAGQVALVGEASASAMPASDSSDSSSLTATHSRRGRDAVDV
jgi:hypothetical protein